ncbi:hypothetical protein TNCV_3976101 [Trichonephila clavipes]|nr:hypothetical protein TNCV_3976101 [Trichonephila clavipes]
MVYEMRQHIESQSRHIFAFEEPMVVWTKAEGTWQRRQRQETSEFGYRTERCVEAGLEIGKINELRSGRYFFQRKAAGQRNIDTGVPGH